MFHPNVPTLWIDRVLEVMAACPQHTFMVLTKRPENIESKLYDFDPLNPARELGGGDYLPNLWMGVTAENQDIAYERIPVLLNTWTAKRFVSVEPMLSEVNIFTLLSVDPGIDWVIAGPESGPGARPAHAEWFASLRNQCRLRDVPFFDKRDGACLREYPATSSSERTASYSYSKSIWGKNG